MPKCPQVIFPVVLGKYPRNFHVIKSSGFFFFKRNFTCLVFFSWMPFLLKIFHLLFFPFTSLLHFLSNSLSCNFLIMSFRNVFLQCSRFVLCFFSSFCIVHDTCSFTWIIFSCNFHHKFPMHLLTMLNMMFIVLYTLFHNAHNKSFKTFCFVL